MIAAPVDATEASFFGTVGTSLAPNVQNLYSWDGEKYVNVPNNSSSITPGLGYFAFVGTNGIHPAASAQNFRGFSNDDVQRPNFSFLPAASGVNFTITQNPLTQSGWNMIGNPFPCALSIEALAAALNIEVEEAVYIYNGVQYDSRSGASLGGVFVGPLQAFWIRTTNTGPALGPNQWSIYSHGTIDQNPAVLKGQSTIEDYFLLEAVDASQPSKKDELTLTIIPNTSDGFDKKWDAWKLSNLAGMPNLYSEFNEDAMAVNAIDYAIGSTKSIHVGFKSTLHGNTYKINLNTEHLKNSYDVILEDKLTNTFHNLIMSGFYSFIHDSTYTTNRFVIHFNQQSISVNELIGNKQNNSNFEAWVHKKQLHIQSFTDQSLEIELWDVQGRTLMKEKNYFTKDSKGIKKLSIEKPGLYILKVGNPSSSLIIKILNHN
jgi:hypothetical protein